MIRKTPAMLLAFALIVAAPSVVSASHSVPSGPPNETGEAPPEAQAAPPSQGAESTPTSGSPPEATEAPPPAPPAKRPKRLVAPSERTVYLESGEINVPLVCRRSGNIRLVKGTGGGVGAAPYECSTSTYRGVATVTPKAAIAQDLSRALAKRSSIPLEAIFKAGSKRLSSTLKLKPLIGADDAGRTPRADLIWTTGYLSCGRPDQLSQPGLRMYHPTVSASGKRADSGFYNDTPSDNWVWYRPYAYFYDHEWWSGDWRGPIYLPPYSTVSLATGEGDLLGDAEQGLNSYIAGASYIWFYNGMKDWNWVAADSPYFGYPVYSNFWCHVA